MNITKLYPKVKVYLHNALWIMGDKIATLGVGFLVTVVVARYLGPEDFGVLSYAISVASLFAAAGHMGLSGLVVREIVKKPDEREVTLGTTFGLKFIGAALGYTLLLTYGIVYEGMASTEFVTLAVAGAVLLFLPFDIFDFWFQAFVQARYVTFSRLTGLAISSAFKLLFAFLGFSVVYFILANLVQSVVVVFLFSLIFRLKSRIKIQHWRFSWEKAKELFGQGWVIYLGSIFAVIYLKIDQIMLRWFEGAGSVGVYAIAAQLSEAWYFVPTAIVTSFFPRLIKLKEENQEQFNKRLQQLFDLLFTMAVGVAVIMTLLSEWIIVFFFGVHYIDSASILVIHIWAGIFIFMRAAFSRWILIENALIFSLITQGTGALLNVGLNYFLIPVFSVQGAAYATLISYGFASFISLYIYSKTRPIFIMMVKSMFIAYRYPKAIIS